MKESIDSKDLPSEGFEENLKSEIKLEDISEITETVEFDVKIKEKTIGSKDFKETEGILIKKESIQSIKTSDNYENEVENFVDLYEVKSETKNIVESDLEEDPLQIPSTNDNSKHELGIKTSEGLENKINIEPDSSEFQQKKEDDSARKFKDPNKASVIPEKLFRCQNCDCQYKYKKSLACHISYVHEGKKPVFKCDQCTKQYSQKFHLNEHIARVHDGKKPVFKCDQCTKQYSQKCHLKSLVFWSNSILSDNILSY